MADLYYDFVFGAVAAAVLPGDTTVTLDYVSEFPPNAILAKGDFYATFDAPLTHPESFETVKITDVNTATNVVTFTPAAVGNHAIGTALKGTLTAAMLKRLRAGLSGATVPPGTDVDLYSDGDPFYEKSTGISYVYDSTVGFQPSVGASRLNWAGAFSQTASYKPNDVVVYNNRLFVCNTAVTGAATPTFVGANTYGPVVSTTLTNPTITFPAGTAVGDMVVLGSGGYPGTTGYSAATLPTGWTNTFLASTNGGFSASGVSIKTLTAADLAAGGATFNGTPAVVYGFGAVMHVFRGVTASAVVATNAGAPYLSPPVTPTTPGFVVKGTSSVSGSSGTVTAISAPGLSNVRAVIATGQFMAQGAQGYEASIPGTASTQRLWTYPFGQVNSTNGLWSVALGTQDFPAASFTEMASDNALVYRGAWTGQSASVNDAFTYQNALYRCNVAYSAATTGVIGLTTASGSTSGAYNVPLPSGSASGDLAVLLLEYTNNYSSTPPSGWTAVSHSGTFGGFTGYSTSQSASLYSRVLTSVDVANGYVNSTGGSNAAGTVSAVIVTRGMAVDATKANGATGNVSPTVTPSGPGYVFVFSADGNNPHRTTTGLTSFSYTDQSGNNANELSIGYASYGSGTFPAFTFTNGSSAQYAAALPFVYTATFPTAFFDAIAAIRDSNGRLQSAAPAAYGDVNIYGPTTVPYTSVSSAYTIPAPSAGGAGFLAVTGAVTVTLPSAGVSGGASFTIKNAIRISGAGTSGTVTIATQSSQTIDGYATFTLATDEAVTVLSNGLNWYVVGIAGFRQLTVTSTATTLGASALYDHVCFASGNTTITLPSALGNTSMYTIKNTGAGTISVAATLGQTIDGSPTYAVSTPNQSIDLLSDGANWRLV